MAKHPHRLQLHQKKTWRCMIPGCRYFIHSGLAFTLPGQRAICWECGEEFELDEEALKDDMPKCMSCRMIAQGAEHPDMIEGILNARIALSKAGVKSVKELTPNQLSTLKMMGLLTDEVINKLRELDEENPTDE